ncbi:MAG: YbbR-like domain-containing protein, partial [Oscillospiraceae bacterium]
MKKNERKFLTPNAVLLLAALLLSVLIWIIIAGFVSKSEANTFTRTVSISYREGEDTYKNQGLVLVGEKPGNATIDLKGNSVPWNVSASDVSVFPDYSAVDGPGTYELRLDARNYALSDFQIEGVSPETVTLQFEYTDTKSLPITGKAPGIEAAEGFFKDTLVLSSTSVEISGPQSEVEKVDQAVAVISDEEVRSESRIYTGVRVRLLDAAGNELTLTPYTLSVSEVEVTVPILEVREIPISVGLTGQPTGFDTEWLQQQMSLSVSAITVAGEPADLDKIQQYEIGYIDLSQFEMGKTYEFPISLRKELKNYDGLKSVIVTFDTTGMAQKTFQLPTTSIRVVNIPKGLAIAPENNEVNVTLIGPADQIKSILSENIVIEVDAFSVTAGQGGQQAIAARVLVPGSSRAFAIGTY